MRSISLFSAALSGVLWVSLIHIGNAQFITSTIINPVGVLTDPTAPTPTAGPQTDCGQPEELRCSGTCNNRRRLPLDCSSSANPTQTLSSSSSSQDTSSSQTTSINSSLIALPTSPAAGGSENNSFVSSTFVSSSTSTGTTVHTPTALANDAALSKSKKQPANKIGPIVGGIVAGLVVIALIIGAVFFLKRRRRRRTTAHAHDFGVLEKSRASSPSVYPAPTNNTYSPPLAQQSPAPPIMPIESHYLMSGYPDPNQPQHQQGAGEMTSIVGAQKPYTRNTQREVDDDGVSLRSPSPVQEGGRAPDRDSVPRLPIYNRGMDSAERGPAL